MDDVTVTTTLCEILAARTGWAWQPTGPAYTSGQVALFYGPIGATPDRAVGVTLYTGTDELENGLAVRRAQVRYRGAVGDPAGADRLADAGFEALQGLARVSGLSLVTRVLVAQLGTDKNARQERADSYQIVIDNQEI